MFSASVLSQLKAAGWDENRYLEQKPFRVFYTTHGFPAPPAPVLDFLSRFGGLEVPFIDDMNNPSLLRFVFADCVGVHREDYDADKEIIGRSIWFIGDCGDAMTSIHMDSDGGCYVVFQEEVAFGGVTGEEFIENILTCQKLRTIWME